MSNSPEQSVQSQGEEPVLFFLPRDDNGYLSNMYLNNFVYEDGRKFNCVEQFFHAGKAELFGDHEALDQIMKVRNGRKQKSLGRKVKGFVEEEWKAGKYQILLLLDGS
ncbi:DUF1768-domain-containing protein [Curvularia clavata]|uniref:DUF1768-domain-containing protein n=1 Tax=Curvularia clavata TaxID=95742 RepID=A0A9Q8ZE38_CURCL|nr:DUF1768-domain-containing protein [Curvularia clavata]